MRVIPPVTADLKSWGENLRRFLGKALNQLDAVEDYSSASEDGHYSGNISSDVTAAAANTAYALDYTAQSSQSISNGTPTTRLVFDEAGEYMISFSAQISSSSASTVNFWFWPRVNGTDVAGSTMKNALHQNDAVLVVSRTAIFNLSAGDYLEAMWATDSTSGKLEASAATAFAPAAPASTIAITRLHG
jgi:hypothetical protein